MDLFSYNYEDWIQRWIEQGLSCVRACDKKKKSLIMRHDVDFMENTTNINLMSAIEERNGIRSTYYIIIADSYRYYKQYKDFFLTLQDRGHEIGLHVTAMERSHVPWQRRNKEDGLNQLDQDIEKMLDDGFDLRTLSAHGSPFEYSNKDLLRDAEIDPLVSFQDLLPLSDCLLTDSRGGVEGLTVRKDVFDGTGGYCITHPELFNEVFGMFYSLSREARLTEDLDHSHLNRLG